MYQANLLIHIHILLQMGVYYCTDVFFFFSLTFPLKSDFSAFLQNTFLSLIYFHFRLTSQSQNEIKLLKSKGGICGMCASERFQSKKTVYYFLKVFSALSVCGAQTEWTRQRNYGWFQWEYTPFHYHDAKKTLRYLSRYGLHPVPFIAGLLQGLESRKTPLES